MNFVAHRQKSVSHGETQCKKNGTSGVYPPKPPPPVKKVKKQVKEQLHDNEVRRLRLRLRCSAAHRLTLRLTRLSQDRDFFDPFGKLLGFKKPTFFAKMGPKTVFVKMDKVRKQRLHTVKTCD